MGIHSLVLIQISFIVLLFFTSAQFSSFLREADIKNIKSKAFNLLSSPGSLQDAYYATKVLEYMAVSEYDCNCQSISSLFSGTIVTGFELFYAVRASKNCRCSDLPVVTDHKKIVEDGLEVRLFIYTPSYFSKIICDLIILEHRFN